MTKQELETKIEILELEKKVLELEKEIMELKEPTINPFPDTSPWDRTNPFDRKWPNIVYGPAGIPTGQPFVTYTTDSTEKVKSFN